MTDALQRLHEKTGLRHHEETPFPARRPSAGPVRGLLGSKDPAGHDLNLDGRTHTRPTSSLSAPTTLRLRPGRGEAPHSSAGSFPSTAPPCHTTREPYPF